VLNVSRVYLLTHSDQLLSPETQYIFEQLLARRIAGEPIAYLIGERAFWTLTLQVTPDVLIPRPETELLVELALTRLIPTANILELGTGSGAIVLALAKEHPDCQFLATDISMNALILAKANAQPLQLTNVQFMQSDWFEKIPQQKFDMLISNPPYIDACDPHLQRGDVRFEPRGALVADKQGLADLEMLIQTGYGYLTSKGWILLEHGYTQGENVRKRMQCAGYENINTYQDLAGLDRVTVGQAL
jgi:release factor glutamine methyltransferase